MVKRLLVVFGILLMGFVSDVIAQDPHFSQFYANPLYLNPALTGSERCPRLSLNYRNQWPAQGNTYVTYSASYDQYLNVLHGGVGFNIISDNQGDGTITSTMLNAMYSYTVSINKNFGLAAGFKVSYIFRQLDWDGFVFPDMIHPVYGVIYSTSENPEFINDSKNYFDFSAGLIGFSKKTFFGLAVHHLSQPSESFLHSSEAVLPRKFTAHFGTDIQINNRNFRRGEFSISPNVIFHQQGADFQQFNWGAYVRRKSVIAGFWLRQNFDFKYDALVMLIGIKQDNMRIGYSYDLTVSPLANSTFGSHEISFAYVFRCNEPKKSMKTISCPSF